MEVRLLSAGMAAEIFTLSFFVTSVSRARGRDAAQRFQIVVGFVVVTDT